MKQIKLIPVSQIISSGAEASRFLQTSIVEIGQNEEIRVRAKDDEMYEIIDGRRRFDALVQAGVARVECIVEEEVSDEDFHLKALVANTGKANKWDEAKHINRLLTDFGWTQNQIAHKLGISQATISQRMRLIEKLGDRAKKALEEQQLKVSVALSLTELPIEVQDSLIETSDKLKSKDVNQAVRKHKTNKLESLFEAFEPVELPLILSIEQVKEALRKTVEIELNGKTYLVDIREA